MRRFVQVLILVGAATVLVIAAAKTMIPKTGTTTELIKQGIDMPRVTQPERKTATSVSKTSQAGAPAAMALIPAGPFIYGEEGKAQKLSLPAFFIDIYEVTKAEYAKVNPYDYPSDKVNHPVVNVSWYDAKRYCAAVGKRLPSEQEWEKAARGSDGSNYPWGDMYDPQKVNAEGRGKGTTPVGQFPSGKSPFGLFDMAGNVWEWTDSDYDSHNKVRRGGSWWSTPGDLHSASRGRDAPADRYVSVGFRCAQDAPK